MINQTKFTHYDEIAFRSSTYNMMSFAVSRDELLCAVLRSLWGVDAAISCAQMEYNVHSLLLGQRWENNKRIKETEWYANYQAQAHHPETHRNHPLRHANHSLHPLSRSLLGLVFKIHMTSNTRLYMNLPREQHFRSIQSINFGLYRGRS